MCSVSRGKDAPDQWRRKGGGRGHAPRAALCRGRHLEGNSIQKFGRFSGELVFALQNGFGSFVSRLQ